jgi:hypothetical protein
MIINNNKEDLKQKNCHLSQINDKGALAMMCGRDEEPQLSATSRWRITTTCAKRSPTNNNFASSNNFNLIECQNVTLSCNQKACQKKGEKMDQISKTPTTRPTRYLILAPWEMNGGVDKRNFSIQLQFPS